MKATEYSKKQAACEAAVEQLKEIAKRIKDLPPQFKQRISQLAAEIKGHDLEQYRTQLIQPSGEYTTLADLLMIIKDATGYTLWQGKEATADEVVCPDSAIFKDQYGIDVKEQDLKYFQFTRKTKGRSDLWLISITAMPGRVWVSLDTERVQWEMKAGGGPIVMNHQFAAAFKKEMEDEGFV